MKEIILNKIKSFFIGFITLNVIWYVLHLIISKSIMPNPIEVYLGIPDLLDNDIFAHFYRSFYRVLWGISLAMLLGLIIGIMAAGTGFIAKILTPLIYFTYPIPKVALLPVVMLLFGLHDTSKIIMITIIIIYQVIIVIRDSVLNIPKETYNTLMCFGATKPQMFFYITLPWALSSILSTMRLAIGTAISVLFFTETYGTRHGMGFYIMDSFMRMNYIEMYSGIVVLSLIGFFTFMAIDILEEIFLKWNKA